MTALQGNLAALTLVVLSGGISCRKTPPTGPSLATLHVAAASDLRRAAPELGQLFTERTGAKVTFTFAASGMLARQLEEGAPYGVFLSASKEHALRTTPQRGAHACDDHSLTLYARGALVLFAKADNPLPSTLSELTHPKYARIAIANPDHAPYGKAAKQALTATGLWDALVARIVVADSVDQALTFAKTGNADVAFASKALLTEGEGSLLPVPPATYDPLLQAAVRCGNGESATRFMTFLKSPDAAAVLARYGFELP
ncbi:MAG: molybdate ABC transporter substrate-binding protein [Polyangiaceae bacterium]